MQQGVVMRQAPPLPLLPAEWHGKEVLVLAMCYCGDLAEGAKATAGLRAIGRPIADVVGLNPFTGWQQAFDPLLIARWHDPAMDQACIGWARKVFEATKPHAAGTAYINFMPEDEIDRVEAAYGGNYPRLAEIKRRYDPDNLFRMNQNVRPS